MVLHREQSHLQKPESLESNEEDRKTKEYDYSQLDDAQKQLMENANNVYKKSRPTSEAIALSFTRMSSNQTNIRKSL